MHVYISRFFPLCLQTLLYKSDRFCDTLLWWYYYWSGALGKESFNAYDESEDYLHLSMIFTFWMQCNYCLGYFKISVYIEAPKRLPMCRIINLGTHLFWIFSWFAMQKILRKLSWIPKFSLFLNISVLSQICSILKVIYQIN